MRRQMNNAGFSLVELIIVVAITSLFIGTVGYGISFVSGKPAEESAQKLLSELQDARTTTMGKYKVDITIKNTSDTITIEQSVYAKKSDVDNSTPTEKTATIATGNVKLEYSSDGTTWTQLASGSSITMKFSRSTGALADSSQAQYFRLSKGQTVKIISIVPLTGRVSME